jgi:Fic-DOC domain mobile mystery protein B
LGLKIDVPPGATPLDPDQVAGLLPGHLRDQQELNEWEFANVARGEEWAFGSKHGEILTVDFLLDLHKQMFGDTWAWAGELRTRDVLPIGIARDQIRVALTELLEDVKAQIQYQSTDIAESAARFHHRLVAIHPFPNGNGRFSRTMADLLLVHAGRKPFEWGANLERKGEAREKYIAALQAADRKDYEPLFALLGLERIE